MNIYLKKILFFLFSLCLLISCRNDDEDTFIPLTITTQPDTAQVSSLATIEVAIFSNDTNIPENGTVTVTTPASGSVTIVDNETPDDIRDDRVLYDPLDDFDGVITFEYTVCGEAGIDCKTETVSITVAIQSPVTVDLLEFPLNTLSGYNFFNGDLASLTPAFRVVPVKPITPLFTDYAKKLRFIWVPEGQKASYISDHEALDFPTGSVLIKVFYYDNVLPNNTTRIIETRLMIKKADGWDFAEYVWNEDQTEAFLETTGDGAFTEVEWIQNGQNRFVNYRIPARTQCIVCHRNSDIITPIGIKPQSLNSNYTYPDETKNQLQHLIDIGYLENNLPPTINTVADWEDVSASLEDRARAYMDINCGNCHKDGGQASLRPIRLAYNDTGLNIESAGICENAVVAIPGFAGDKLIEPGSSQNSILSYRIKITNSQYTMPQFGRNLEHTEGLALIDAWIDSLTETCD